MNKNIFFGILLILTTTVPMILTLSGIGASVTTYSAVALFIGTILIAPIVALRLIFKRN